MKRACSEVAEPEFPRSRKPRMRVRQPHETRLLKLEEDTREEFERGLGRIDAPKPTEHVPRSRKPRMRVRQPHEIFNFALAKFDIAQVKGLLKLEEDTNEEFERGLGRLEAPSPCHCPELAEATN